MSERHYERERSRDHADHHHHYTSQNQPRSRSHSRHKEKKEENRRERRVRVSKWTDGPVNPSGLNSSKPTLSQMQTSSIQNTLTKSLNFQSSNFSQNPNTNTSLSSQLQESNKIKKKIYIPKDSGINYVGLLIGPKGTFQKRLEKQSGCKILVRGRGTQKEGLQPSIMIPEEQEDQHVLIVGDTVDSVQRAEYLINQILKADDVTRAKIKDEQIKASQEIRTEQLLKDGSLMRFSKGDGTNEPLIAKCLMTPYGPPDKNAKILPIPDDCVGLIIGKNGDTIRRLNRESGCKIQIAIEPVPNTASRNVFIEGPMEKYEIAKKLIEDIITEQMGSKTVSHASTGLGEINNYPGPHIPLKIPNHMVGLIIGRNGETVREINRSTGCLIYIPKESRPGEDYRELQLSGSQEAVERCKKHILNLIQLGLCVKAPPGSQGQGQYNMNNEHAEGDINGQGNNLLPMSGSKERKSSTASKGQGINNSESKEASSRKNSINNEGKINNQTSNKSISNINLDTIKYEKENSDDKEQSEGKNAHNPNLTNIRGGAIPVVQNVMKPMAGVAYPGTGVPMQPMMYSMNPMMQMKTILPTLNMIQQKDNEIKNKVVELKYDLKNYYNPINEKLYLLSVYSKKIPHYNLELYKLINAQQNAQNMQNNQNNQNPQNAQNVQNTNTNQNNQIKTNENNSAKKSNVSNNMSPHIDNNKNKDELEIKKEDEKITE